MPVIRAMRGEGPEAAPAIDRHVRPLADIDPIIRCHAAASPKRSLEQLRSILARSMSAMWTFLPFVAATACEPLSDGSAQVTASPRSGSAIGMSVTIGPTLPRAEVAGDAARRHRDRLPGHGAAYSLRPR